MTGARTVPGPALARAVAGLTVVRFGGVGAGFLVAVVGARALGPDGIGLAGVAQTLGTLVGLIANGGITMATVYLLGRNRDERPRLAGALVALALVSAGLGAVATLMAGGVVAAIGALTLGLVAAAAVLAAAAVAAETAGAVLLGIDDSSGYTIGEVVRSLGTLALAVPLMLLVPSPEVFVLAAAGGMLAGAAFAWRRARRQLPGSRPMVDLATWRAALAFGLRGQVGNVLQFFTLRLDVLLVAALAGAGPTGLYVIAARISEAATQVANAGATLLFPRVAMEDRPGATNTPRIIGVTTGVVAVGGLAIAIGAVPGLPLVFGPAFGDALVSLWILLVAAIPLSVGRLLAGDLKGRGRPGVVSIAAGLGLAVTVVGDLALIPVAGIEGAAAVSLVGYTVHAVALGVAWRRELRRSMTPA